MTVPSFALCVILPRTIWIRFAIFIIDRLPPPPHSSFFKHSEICNSYFAIELFSPSFLHCFLVCNYEVH